VTEHDSLWPLACLGCVARHAASHTLRLRHALVTGSFPRLSRFSLGSKTDEGNLMACPGCLRENQSGRSEKTARWRSPVDEAVRRLFLVPPLAGSPTAKIVDRMWKSPLSIFAITDESECRPLHMLL
jgi:hypothetical protein